jgi:acetyl esterase/lipase
LFPALARGHRRALAGPCAAAPLAAYGALPHVEDAALSTDGAMVAMVVTDGEKRVVEVLRPDDPKPVLSIQAGPTKVRGVHWVGPDHLFITASYAGKMADVVSDTAEWFEVLDINVKAGTQMNLLGGARGALPAVIRAPQVRFLHGTPFAFAEAYYFISGVGVDCLFRVNLTNGDTQLVGRGQPSTDGWLVDAAGQPLAESRYDPKLSQWALFVRHADLWRLADEGQTHFGHLGELGLGRDGRSVLAGNEEDGRLVLRELAPEATAWSEPLGVPQAADLIFDPVDARLIGYRMLAGDAAAYVFFSATDQANWNAAVKAFPGARVELTSLSADHQKLLIAVDSPTDGMSYAIVDTAANTVHRLGPVYAGLTPADIAAVKPIAFKAADGLPLTGYLTLPNGRAAKDLPLVVFPHGGPAMRDTGDFDWWAQAMASRGYAVLQINYRGSADLGEAFLEAGYGQWGRKMQTDLSDGVRYLAAQGTIDPKRVCIVGASYGGYAALAGVTLDPGVYRCAVAVSGLSDLRRFVGWSGERNTIASQRYWDRYMGAGGPGDPLLTSLSPVSHVADITVPVLLIHGKDDTVVPFEQSQMMADALRKAGKPFDFVVLNHEDHWLSTGATRLQMLQATMDFVEKHNPPG